MPIQINNEAEGLSIAEGFVPSVPRSVGENAESVAMAKSVRAAVAAITDRRVVGMVLKEDGLAEKYGPEWEQYSMLRFVPGNNLDKIHDEDDYALPELGKHFGISVAESAADARRCLRADNIILEQKRAICWPRFSCYIVAAKGFFKDTGYEFEYLVAHSSFLSDIDKDSMDGRLETLLP
jgi:hypothetical protein